MKLETHEIIRITSHSVLLFTRLKTIKRKKARNNKTNFDRTNKKKKYFLLFNFHNKSDSMKCIYKQQW